MQEKLENALPSPLSKKKYYLKSLNLSLVLLLISNLTNALHLHQFLETGLPL